MAAAQRDRAEAAQLAAAPEGVSASTPTDPVPMANGEYPGELGPGGQRGLGHMSGQPPLPASDSLRNRLVPSVRQPSPFRETCGSRLILSGPDLRPAHSGDASPAIPIAAFGRRITQKPWHCLKLRNFTSGSVSRRVIIQWHIECPHAPRNLCFPIQKNEHKRAEPLLAFGLTLACYCPGRALVALRGAEPTGNTPQALGESLGMVSRAGAVPLHRDIQPRPPAAPIVEERLAHAARCWKAM